MYVQVVENIGISTVDVDTRIDGTVAETAGIHLYTYKGATSVVKDDTHSTFVVTDSNGGTHTYSQANYKVMCIGG